MRDPYVLTPKAIVVFWAGFFILLKQTRRYIMIKINFSTGEVYQGADAISVYDAASSLGIVSREHIVCRFNGELKELSTIVTGEADVALLTFKDEEGNVYTAKDLLLPIPVSAAKPLVLTAIV